MSSLHFFCTPLKNLSGDGRPSQSQETCLPNGVTQAGSWSNWLPAQLLFHQAAAQTLPPTCTAVYSKRSRTVARSLPCSKVKSRLRPRLVSTQPAVCARASIFARVPNTRRVSLVSPPHFFHDVQLYMYSSRLFSWSLSSCYPFIFINVIAVATSSQKVHRNIAAPRSCPRPLSVPGNQ